MHSPQSSYIAVPHNVPLDVAPTPSRLMCQGRPKVDQSLAPSSFCSQLTTSEAANAPCARTVSRAVHRRCLCPLPIHVHYILLHRPSLSPSRVLSLSRLPPLSHASHSHGCPLFHMPLILTAAPPLCTISLAWGGQYGRPTTVDVSFCSLRSVTLTRSVARFHRGRARLQPRCIGRST
jgi:hypothetical protein